LDPGKLTKKQICAIAFTAFGGLQLKDSESKPSLVDKLAKLLAEQPDIIGPATKPAKATRPATRKKAPVREEDSEEEDSEEDDSEEDSEEEKSDDDDDGDDDDDDDAAPAAAPADVNSSDGDDTAAERAAADAAERAAAAAERAAAKHTAAERAAAKRAAKVAHVKLGRIVHVPHSAFPDEDEPENGFWPGKTVRTNAGGPLDVGILIDGEEVFTRPMTEVALWVV
jgi:hypothetical protein